MNININVLKRGDVLLAHNSDRQHVAIYLGDGEIVHAAGTYGHPEKGDQTGKEICISKIYGDWDIVLRCPDENISATAVLFALRIACDDAHGYSKVDRWGEDYDCSSLVVSAFEYAGLPVKENGGSWTGNLEKALKSCGFVEVTEQITCTVELVEVRPGDRGQAVKTMQTLLLMRGYDCGQPDGIYGNKTRSALDRYLKDNKLTPYDSICGQKTWRKLIL